MNDFEIRAATVQAATRLTRQRLASSSSDPSRLIKNALDPNLTPSPNTHHHITAS